MEVSDIGQSSENIAREVDIERICDGLNKDRLEKPYIEHMVDDREDKNRRAFGENNLGYYIAPSDIARIYVFSDLALRQEQTYRNGEDEYNPNNTLQSDVIHTGKDLVYALLHQQILEADNISLLFPTRHSEIVEALDKKTYESILRRLDNSKVPQEIASRGESKLGFSDNQQFMLREEGIDVRALIDDINVNGIGAVLEKAQGNKELMYCIAKIAVFTTVRAFKDRMAESLKKGDKQFLLDSQDDPNLLWDTLHIFESFQSETVWRKVAMHTDMFLRGDMKKNIDEVTPVPMDIMALNNYKQLKKQNPWLAQYYVIDLMVHDAHASGDIIRDIISPDDLSDLNATLAAHDAGTAIGDAVLHAQLSEHDRAFLNQHYRFENKARRFLSQPESPTKEEALAFMNNVLRNTTAVYGVLVGSSKYRQLIRPLIALLMDNDYLKSSQAGEILLDEKIDNLRQRLKNGANRYDTK